MFVILSEAKDLLLKLRLCMVVFPAVSLSLRAQSSTVRAPTIVGPIPTTAAPGDASHNYPFGSTVQWLVPFDYVEEEFYVEGVADAYSNGRTTFDPVPGGPFPYKTRVTVHRPRSAARFNGTVILEWIVASGDQDQENEWVWSHEHLMRAGYAHVGVSVEPVGVSGPIGLKHWNPERYGSLDVTAGGKFDIELSFDVFSQVAFALKHPSGVPLLGKLRVRNIVAAGHSQGAFRLRYYYQNLQPMAGVIDGFVLHGVNAAIIRTDLRTPILKLLSERELIGLRARHQSDHAFLRTWQVAGAAHGGRDLIEPLDALLTRDSPERVFPDSCQRPKLSDVPIHYVLDAGFDAMKRWIERGTPPPTSAAITLVPPGAPPESLHIARDTYGNALGGIRLPHVAVPIATNTGENGGARYCSIYGSHEPFADSTLARLYPTRARYAAMVARVADENLRAGFITKEGADAIKRDAARVTWGSHP